MEITRKSVSHIPACLREKIQAIIDDPNSFQNLYQQYKNAKPEIIPGAAYVVYDTHARITDSIMNLSGSVSASSRYVVFYSSEGEPLEVVPYSVGSQIPLKMIDPNAAPIKIASYKRIWWPAFNVGFGMTKGSAGYRVLLHDRNGNRIGCGSFNYLDDIVSDFQFLGKYDLNEAVAEPDDFSLKPTESVAEPDDFSLKSTKSDPRNKCTIC